MYRRILVLAVLVLLTLPLVAPQASAREPSSTPGVTIFWQAFLDWSQKTLGIAPAVPTTSSDSDPTADPNGEDKGFGMDPNGLTISPDAGPTVELNGLSGDKGPTVDPNG